MARPKTRYSATRETPRMNRQIERIMAAIRKQPMTAIQIADALYSSHDTARFYVSMLHKEKRIHVAAWKPVMGNKPAKMYLAGGAPDVIYQPKMRAKKDKRVQVWQDLALEALALPMTSHQLATKLGISYSYATSLIRGLRSEKLIHIKAWVLPHVKGSKAAVHAAGYYPDKVRTSTRRRSVEAPRMLKPKKQNVFASMLAA